MVHKWCIELNPFVTSSICICINTKEKAGMSEDVRRVCRKLNIGVVFKSGCTLCSMLTKVKDTLPLGKQSNVAYCIPCSCGQVYIGETKRRLEMRLKEH